MPSNTAGSAPGTVVQPSVYTAEAPDRPGPIPPVSTGVTAFVGRAAMGQVELATSVFSVADFVRIFGTVDAAFPLSIAVEDFFDHGGSEAVIVRLYTPTASTGDGAACMSIGQGDGMFVLRAASPGAWGNRLTATIEIADITEVTARQFEDPYGLGAADLFNLTLALQDSAGAVILTERHLNLSIRSDGPAANFPKRIDRVLGNQSTLGRVEHLPAACPGPGSWMAAGGDDGAPLTEPNYLGDHDRHTGFYALETVLRFNLLVMPPDQAFDPARPETACDLPAAVRHAAAIYCTDRRAVFIVDPPFAWRDRSGENPLSALDRDALGVHGTNAAGNEIARNAALYFPLLWGSAESGLRTPSGAVAGVIAANDVARGVWTAPAGSTAGLRIARLDVALNDTDGARLNQLGINCLRNLPTIGPVIWGGRTLHGADQFEDDYKYLSVRRLALFIEDSIIAGTRWAAFESNDEQLWSSLQLAIDAFMGDLKRQGAFHDYYARCDASTTTPDDIANGVVNALVFFAPIAPAEFIVLQFSQMAGMPAA